MILSLEQQVAPLTLCQRLCELGAPQESEFWWYGAPPKCQPVADTATHPHPLRAGGLPGMCPAFTTDELCSMLPRESQWFIVSNHVADIPGEEWVVCNYDKSIRTADAAIAGACAKHLIVLAERGIITWGKQA